jgi:hypothetical protein
MLRMNSRVIAFIACTALLLASHAAPSTAGESEIVREESIDVASWSATVVQRSHGPANSDAVLLDVILIERSRTRVLAKNIIGPIVIFDAQRKLVSCESQGSVMVGRGPIIFQLDGRRADGPNHPGYLRGCARVERSSLLLLHYNLVRNGKPLNFARVITADGAIVVERELYRAGELTLLHEGKTYRVQLPEPDWPG